MNKRLIAGIAGAVAFALAAPAAAQSDSRYDFGNVWYVSGIDVHDGQFENYMNWLATEWTKFRKLNAQHGNEVGYYVLGNTTARDGEPDLYLVTIHKDFMKIAEGMELEKKVNAAMAKDRKQFDKESADRGPMRTTMGTMELMEFKLK